MELDYLNKKKLEILLGKLKWPSNLNEKLEQYFTDPGIASSILFRAYLNGDIHNKVVADLGAGYGIFAYGSAVLGARETYAIEVDSNLVRAINENCRGLNVTTIQKEVAEFTRKVDTVIMNPPFGSVIKHSDLKFLQSAVTIARRIYSIHNERSLTFIQNFYHRYGRIIEKYHVDFILKRQYDYQERDYATIPAVFLVVDIRGR